MTMDKVLLAVHDSAASLAAARTAVELAEGWHARLRVVNVVTDGHITEALHRTGSGDLPVRRARAGASVLEHVAQLAQARGVPAESAQLEGEVAREVLDDARRWHADLLVVGMTSHDGLGTPSLGPCTTQLLEFAEVPVLVVPSAAERGGPGGVARRGTPG